jgi:hypothetical protein
MAIYKPLVLINGQVAQLQSGDSIIAPQTGGDVVVQTNDEATSIVICTPVYNDASDGVKKAKADAAAAKNVIGMVQATTIANGASGIIQVNGVLTATTAQWDVVTGQVGGLIQRTRYYLSGATAGMITDTAPSTAGQYVVEVGIALSATELKIDVSTPILL